MDPETSRYQTSKDLRLLVSSISTFLSPKVYELVVRIDSLQTSINEEKIKLKYLNEDGIINWVAFPFSGERTGERFSQEWFSEGTSKIVELLNESQIWLRHANGSSIGKLIEQCSWMGNREILRTCFELAIKYPGNPAEIVECVLLFTAALDRALRNVFNSKSPGKVVPFLIRDLLQTSELEEVLGEKAVLLLQLLMGSPFSLNLRNLAWHGFVSPDELSPQYASILLITAATVGSHICATAFTERSYVTFPTMNKTFLNAEEEPRKLSIENIFRHSNLIHDKSRSLWLLALERFYGGQYGRCLSLLLPQLENLLRCMFAVVNQQPDRMLTAQSDVLYVTLDVILSDIYTEDKTHVNRLKSYIGVPALVALRDLFLFPEGPRLRDRLSHGECWLEALSRSLASHVIMLTAGILLSSEDRKHTREEELLLECLNQYESSFHPLALLRSEVLETLDLLSKWSETLKQVCRDLGWVVEQIHRTDIENGIISHWLDNNEFAEREISTEILSRKLNIAENCLANLSVHRQLVQDLRTGSSNAVNSIREKYRECKEKTLRSRQRVTFQRMLDLCPLLISATKLCLLPCVTHFVDLDTAVWKVTERELKVVIKFSSNLPTLSRSNKNRWLELGELAKSVTDLLLRKT